MQTPTIFVTGRKVGKKSGTLQRSFLSTTLHFFYLQLEALHVMDAKQISGWYEAGISNNILEYMSKSKLNCKCSLHITNYHNWIQLSRKEVNLKKLSSWHSWEVFLYWNELPHSCLKPWPFCPFYWARYLSTREGPGIFWYLSMYRNG